MSHPMLWAMVKRLAGLVMRREIVLDERVSGSYVVPLLAQVAIGLARGLIFTRRRLVLGSGSRVLQNQMLHLGGGLVRIEQNCTINCLSTNGVTLGRNFRLGAFSRIIASGSLRDIGVGVFIGDDVGIGEYSYIGGAGGVHIGSQTIVGQYFSVHPENHVFADPRLPVKVQGVTRKGIRVGSGCWIGAKVTLCDGVTIGDNSVVAAGSVVTRSFPHGSVIGGVPARLLRASADEHDASS